MKIILVGAGGHSAVVIDVLRLLKGFSIVGLIDKKEKVGTLVSGVRVCGDDRSMTSWYKRGVRHCFICVGSIGNPGMRRSLAERAEKIGFVFPNIIHPGACLSVSACLGKGIFVAAGAVIGPHALISDQCIINTKSSVDHDCRLGGYVHIAPGVTLSGGVTVGEGSHIGTGASIIQGITVGKNCMIAAGSVVVADIPNSVTAMGNPCRVRGRRC